MFDFIEGILDFFLPGEPDDSPRRQKPKSTLERLATCGCVVVVLIFTFGVIWFAFNAEAILNSITSLLP